MSTDSIFAKIVMLIPELFVVLAIWGAVYAGAWSAGKARRRGDPMPPPRQR